MQRRNKQLGFSSWQNIGIVKYWCSAIIVDKMFISCLCDTHKMMMPMWVAVDVHVGCSWCPCGSHSVPMWVAFDAYLGCIWCPCGLHLMPMWNALDAHVGCIWCPYGLHWCPCNLHKFNLISSIFDCLHCLHIINKKVIPLSR